MRYDLVMREIEGQAPVLERENITENELIHYLEKYGDFETLHENHDGLYTGDGNWVAISPFLEVSAEETEEVRESSMYDSFNDSELRESHRGQWNYE